MATLTTALTPITDTADRCQDAEKSNSITFTVTKPAMDKATQATPVMKQVVNTRSPDIGAEAMAVATGAARVQSQ
jgi:hypothetical protein